MVNFEYNQLLRFLECSKYWDIPEWVSIIAKLYLPITYTLKIMLSQVQATSVKSNYIMKVFTGDDSLGLLAVKAALQVGVQALKSPNMITLKDFILSLNIPDILIHTEEQSETSNSFAHTLINFMSKNMYFYALVEAPTLPRTRNEESKASFENASATLNCYIISLWKGIHDRFKYMDLTGETCWSEAPAESVFSTWQYIIDHRPSLTVKHTESICRIIRDGPNPASSSAEILMQHASGKWKSEHGMRFTTQNWQPGFVSNIVEKLQHEI